MSAHQIVGCFLEATQDVTPCKDSRLRFISNAIVFFAPCRCIGPLGLSVICRMLAEDYQGWRGGMPDLLLWRPQVCVDEAAVKTDGDMMPC